MSRVDIIAKKGNIINGIKNSIKNHDCFYVVNIGKMSNNTNILFRKICKKNGVEVKVTKNSFIARAIDELNLKETDKSNIINKWLNGISAMLFINESYSVPGKLIKTFKNEVFDDISLKFAYAAGDLYYGQEGLNYLSTMKTLSELLNDIASAINSSRANIASALLSLTKVNNSTGEQN